MLGRGGHNGPRRRPYKKLPVSKATAQRHTCRWTMSVFKAQLVAGILGGTLWQAAILLFTSTKSFSAQKAFLGSRPCPRVSSTVKEASSMSSQLISQLRRYAADRVRPCHAEIVANLARHTSDFATGCWAYKCKSKRTGAAGVVDGHASMICGRKIWTLFIRCTQTRTRDIMRSV